MRIYMCALPIKKGAAVPQEFISDDPAKLEEWAKRHDQPGWGVYRCPNPLKDGATSRSKDTIKEVRSIRIDLTARASPKRSRRSMRTWPTCCYRLIP
jgi:hypothetical protein